MKSQHHQPIFYRRLSLLLLFLVINIGNIAHADDYSIGKQPDWVETAPVPDDVAQERDGNKNGVAYQHVEEQIRVGNESQERFVRFIDKALNTTGVTEVSRISIDFDPHFQALTLHGVRIHRNGEIIDMQDRSRISLLQREKDLEHQIYDGSRTLNIFLEDVRVGDRIEYSYTISGANPVFSGHFYRRLLMQWSVPVSSLYYKLIWEADRPLQIRTSTDGLQPQSGKQGDAVVYEWKRNSIEGLTVDDKTPDWYNPYDSVYLSDFSDWEQVTQWALPLYEPATDTPLIRSVIDTITSSNTGEEDRILAALHFVQDEVRYLGIEMGERSHKPNPPDTVIRQRFGDCKDKTRLLVSLLHAMDIQASPVLVNSDNGHYPHNALPSPKVFNHAITQVSHDGRKYWLDPTRSHQQGRLDTLFQPDYDYALVISKDHSGLSTMSDDIQQVHGKRVVETFDLRDPAARTTSYVVESDFDGYYADSLRDQVASSNTRQLEQSYLNYTATIFPGAELAAELQVRDSPMENSIHQVEKYSIPDILQLDDNEAMAEVYFSPYLINDHVKKVTTPVRTMPYSIAHPVRYRHVTRIKIADGEFEDEKLEVNDKAFRYRKTVSYANNLLVIDYLYESLADHVEAADISTFSNNIRKLRDNNGYSIQMPNPAIKFGAAPQDRGDINWPVVIGLLLFVAFLTILLYRKVYLHDPPYKKPAGEIHTEYEGIGGWLIFPAIGMFLTVVALPVAMIELAPVLSKTQIALFNSVRGESIELVLAISMAVNLALLVMVLFLIVMFFTRRHTFPRLYIGYLLLSLAVTIIDIASIYFLDYEGIVIEATDIRDLVRQGIISMLWIAYFKQSKRVKATFTRRLKQGATERFQDDTVQPAEEVS